MSEKLTSEGLGPVGAVASAALHGTCDGIRSRERPILFRPELVREILAGRKTVTRRPVKPQPEHDPFPCYWVGSGWSHRSLGDRTPDNDSCTCREIRCPYNADRLWVRETWSELAPHHFNEPGLPRDALSDRYGTPRRNGAAYLADSLNRHGVEDGDGKVCRLELGYRWRPGIHMPRWACRLVLAVVSVRVERLQDITEEDAAAEGVGSRAAFVEKWNTLYGGTPFFSQFNPWVWRVEFSRTTAVQPEPSPPHATADRVTKASEAISPSVNDGAARRDETGGAE